jgi:uncharacterized protein
MKFSEILSANTKRIEAYDAAHFRVSGQRFEHDILLLPDAGVQPWSALPAESAHSTPTADDQARAELAPPTAQALTDSLTAAALATLFDGQPQLVIIGTGAHQLLPPPALLSAGAARGIGVEWMRTGAACRTYNLLASEGRRVAAGLLLERL